MAREPILFCFCGPAGSGKSSICTKLLEREAQLTLSISTTSRAPRGSEKDGVEYHFVSKEDFESRIASKRFIEHAVFHLNYYGTETSNIERARASEKDLLLDIDVQGAEQLRKLFPAQVVVVFLFPPNFRILEQRFRDRKTDSEEKIQARLKIAREEIDTLSQNGFSDYLIVNDDFDVALAEAKAIVLAERCKFSRLSTERKEKLFQE